MILNGDGDKLIRFRAVWIVETFAMFLDKDDLKRVMLHYGKILTDKENKESELIKAASAMAIFRYLSEADTDEKPLTASVIKEYTSLDLV